MMLSIPLRHQNSRELQEFYKKLLRAILKLLINLKIIKYETSENIINILQTPLLFISFDLFLNTFSNYNISF
jgi:hypothetical protein